MENDIKIEKMMNKVKGLIDLSKKNDNDEEAQSAFLMAQKLMLKYHISAESVQLVDSKEKVNNSDVTSLKRLHWWEKLVGQTIADNFRVKMYITHTIVRGKNKLVYMGLDDDLKIAKSMYDLVSKTIKAYSKKFVDSWYVAQAVGRNRGLTEHLKNSYMQGFILGMKNKFDEQFNKLKQEYGLMVMTPKKVEESYNKMNLKYEKVGVQSRVNGEAFTQGKSDGNSIDYKQTVNA